MSQELEMVKVLTEASACLHGSCYRVNENHVSKIPESTRSSANRRTLPALGTVC